MWTRARVRVRERNRIHFLESCRKLIGPSLLPIYCCQHCCFYNCLFISTPPRSLESAATWSRERRLIYNGVMKLIRPLAFIASLNVGSNPESLESFRSMT